MERAEISFKLRGGTRYDEETGNFVSLCPRLGVYSQGRTKEEAEEALKSTLMLYVETCFRRKRLDDVLLRAGFAQVPTGDIPAECGADEYIKIEHEKFDSTFDIEIPLNLIAAEASNRAINPHSPTCV